MPIDGAPNHNYSESYLDTGVEEPRERDKEKEKQREELMDSDDMNEFGSIEEPVFINSNDWRIESGTSNISTNFFDFTTEEKSWYLEYFLGKRMTYNLNLSHCLYSSL